MPEAGGLEPSVLRELQDGKAVVEYGSKGMVVVETAGSTARTL